MGFGLFRFKAWNFAGV